MRVLRCLLILMVLFSSAVHADELAYLRLAFWNLDGLGKKGQETRDYAQIGRVAVRFDVLAIQGLTTIKDLDGLIQYLNSTGTSKWSRLGGGDGNQAAPSVIWRSERASYDGFVRATPLTTKVEAAIHPLLIARMRYDGKPFYLAIIDNGEKLSSDKVITLAERHINSLVRYSQGVPVFIGISLQDSIRESYLEKLEVYTKIVIERQPTAVLTKSWQDTVLTTYPRPVRAGVFPFPKLLAIDGETAKRTISPRLPLFVLTNLAQ